MSRVVDGSASAQGSSSREEPPDAGPVSRADSSWPWICGLFAMLLAMLISDQVFGRIPHVQDSIAQLFQARIFANGRLWWPAPPLAEFFEYTNVVMRDGRWYSHFPPGHALLLVPGVWAGAPWIANPLFAGLTVVGIHALARDLFGNAVARVSALLALISPFFMIMAGEFMSHSSALCAVTWFLVFLFRAMKSGRRSHGLAAGALLCLAILIRPYSTLGAAGPFLLHAGWKMYRERGRMMQAGSCIAAGGIAGVLVLALYNLGTTGDPLLPGFIKLQGESDGLGLGGGSWGPSHTLHRGLLAAGQSIGALNLRLFEWPLTSLWPLFLGMIPLWDRSSLPRRALLLTAPIGLLFVHVFYGHDDFSIGPRNLYESLAPVLILSACGIVMCGGCMARLLLPRAGGWLRALPAALLVVGLLGYAGATRIPALFQMTPEAAAAEPGTVPRIASYFQRLGREFWGVSPYMSRLVDRQVEKPALVFTRFLEPEFDLPQMRHLWFGSAFAVMDPDMRGAGVVYARDMGHPNRLVADMFPSRAVYLYDGSIEHGRLELLRGPLSSIQEVARPLRSENARVVVTTTMIASAVSDLASDWCRVDVLIPPAGCPGYFDIGPQTLASLQGAAAVFYHDYQKHLEARLADGDRSKERFVLLVTRGPQTLPEPYLDLCAQTAEALKQRFPGRARMLDASLDSLRIRVNSFAERTSTRSRPILREIPLLVARYQAPLVEWTGGRAAATFNRGDDMSMREMRDLLEQARGAGVRGVVGNLQWGEREVRSMAEELTVPGVVLSSYPFSTSAGAWEDLMRRNVEIILSLVEDG